MASAYQFLYSPMEKALTKKFTNGTGGALVGGTFFAVGSNYGIVLDDTPDGEDGVLILAADDIAVPKTAGEAYTDGENLYYDVANEVVTNLDGGGANPWRGRANADTAGADATVRMMFTNRAL